ncbi:hypothetical protein D1871_05555 [Nakamurella silvestris]|nr:hypothetical protein D1871_05555 [Nakamurella silvestris]
MTCWNAEVVTDTADCAEISGVAGLQWVFSTARGFDLPACEEQTGTLADGQLEGYRCTYPDLKDTTVFLSRWTDTAAAEQALDQFTGLTSHQRADDGSADSARMDGLQWGPEKTDPVDTSDKGSEVFAFAYNSLPYSIEIYVDPVDGASEELDTALNRQYIGFADIVRDRANPA